MLRRRFVSALSGYSVSQAAYLLYCLLRTRLFYPYARLIRFPFRIRIQGEFTGARDLTTGKDCRFDVFQGGKLTIGKNVQFNDYCHIACGVSLEIGDHVLIASRVYITDHDHKIDSSSMQTELLCRPTAIGKRVWIGEGACILKGVILGDDCVIGANSVVTKSFSKGSVVCGAPAVLVKMRNFAF